MKFIYGDLGRVNHSGRWSPRNSSQWWRDLTWIELGLPTSMHWFSKEIRRKVGNGKGTSFWHETLLENSSLKEEFPRLFSLSEQSNVDIADMGWWDGDMWWDWKWRRDFFVWEEELFQLFSDTMVVAHHKEVDDVWVWMADSSKNYSVKPAYVLLQEQQLPLLSNQALARIFKNFCNVVPRLKC